MEDQMILNVDDDIHVFYLHYVFFLKIIKLLSNSKTSPLQLQQPISYSIMDYWII